MAKQKRLGEMLLDAGLISEAQLQGALERQRKWGGRFGRNLVLNGAISDEDLMRYFAARTGIKELDISGIQILPHIIKKIPLRVAEKYNLIPLAMKDKNTLIVALSDPTDLEAIDQVSFITGLKVEPVITAYDSISKAIERFYPGSKPRTAPVVEEREVEGPRMVEMESMERHGGHQSLEDPDLIIFGNQSGEPTMDSGPPAGVAPPPEPYQFGEDNSDPSIDDPDEYTLDFDSLSNTAPPVTAPTLKTAAVAAKPSVEKKLLALCRVLVRKGLVEETELRNELRRLL